MKPTHEELVATIEAQAQGMDWLAASLILATHNDKTNEPFFLSKSPVWQTMTDASKILERCKEEK